MAIFSISQVWGETATYTPTSASAVSTTGTAPEGSSCSYAQTYNTKCQATSGNSITYTLSGYDGCTITGLTLSLGKAKNGAGTYSMTINGVQKASGSDFNGTSSSGEDSSPTVTQTLVGNSQNIVVTITNTSTASKSNSVYCYSITLTYTPAPTDPAVTVDPSPVAFGTVKQHAIGDLGTEYVFETFTVTGENLENNITVNKPAGSIFALWNPETEMQINSIELTPDANGNVEKELAIMAATGWSGAQNGSFTISGTDLAEDSVINITMNVTPTFNVAVDVNDDEMGTATINGQSAVYTDGDDVLNIVATPKPGYEFVNWTVSDGDVLEVASETSATTTVTAIAAGTVTASFTAQSCSSLAAPTLDEENTQVTYEYANLAWTAVANAETYAFVVTKHGESTPHVSSSTGNTSTMILNLDANTQYDYSVMAKGDGSTYCDENNPLLEGSFTTDDYPAAVLTLSENGVTREWGSDLKITSVIALPTAVAAGNEVAGKVLVGWSASEIEETDVKPAYTDKGANFTMNETAVTLYAVYAKETGDVEPVLSQTLQYDTWTYSGATSDKTSYRLFGEDAYVESASFDRSTLTKVTVYAGKFGSVSTPKLIVSDGTNTWAESPELTTKSHTTQVDITEGTALTGIGTIRIISNAGDGGSLSSSSGIRLSKVEIYTQIPVSYSKYTTSGAKAPTATVDPEEVEISAAALVGGLIDVTYENVNQANVTVALFNDAECTEAFDGGWLTASLDANKDIVYGAEAAVSYANVRTAYIKLTAPSTDNTVDPAIVVIPVTQAYKDRVFASFEELNNSDLPRSTGGTAVQITFSNEKIASVDGRSVYLNIKDKVTTTENIQIYGPSSSSWAAGGYISGENISGTWKVYSSVMEFVVTTWDGINYSDTPTSLEDVETSVKAVKVLRNGILLIEKNGHTYNAQGQLVK